MAKVSDISDDIASKPKRRKRKPATTPESRENQLVSLAIDLAEQQLRDGTASSAVITHYLKLGSMKEKAELERLKLENELVIAKTETLKATKNIEEMYTEAMEAFKGYRGTLDRD